MPASAEFITAPYTATGPITAELWSIMMRRYLGLNVYDYPDPVRACTFCHSFSLPLPVPRDRLGYHAVACKAVYGLVARHNAVCNAPDRADYL